MSVDFSLGRAIKKLKVHCDITNNDIASVTSKSVTTVSLWCSDKQSPSLSTIEMLCGECGVLLSEFIKWGER